MLSTFLFSVGITVTFMTLAFAVAWLKKYERTEKLAWGGGFIVLIAFVAWSNRILDARQAIIVVLVVIWGLRHIWQVLAGGQTAGEVIRRRELKEKWQSQFLLRSFFQIYMFRALLITLIATPIIILFSSESLPLGIFDLAGILIWITGFSFETISDLQLKKFLQDPANQGRIMRTGLWRLSCHPNYFGKSLVWWGIFIMVSPLPFAVLSIVSPLLITYLLLRITGLPQVEKRFADDAEYQEYRKTTSVFIPWFPKGPQAAASLLSSSSAFVADTSDSVRKQNNRAR